MVFSSPIFLFAFLPLLLLLHQLAPQKVRNSLLLIASLLFYAWGEGRYVALMLASIGANYVFGLWIDGCGSNHSKKRWAVALAVVFNLGVLLFFKYFNFIADTVQGVVTPEAERIHLPIGISFYTFQALSYIIDVASGRTKVQRGLHQLALYIALFPQLIAGPIIRYHDVARQIERRWVSAYGMYYGIKRFVIGLAKKVLIANTLGEVATEIFEIPAEGLHAGVAWQGIVFYTLQIYFDFSGYSDMAIGLGRMFGFRFLENFNYPYIARSIKEFWRRWHISLSNWFRDYLYIPLGGSRKGPSSTYFNLLIVFFLCGLWHGASWSFVVWGMYHGLFLIIERWIKVPPLKIKLLGHVYTLLVVMIGWVFFNAKDLTHAIEYLSAMFGLGEGDGIAYYTWQYLNNEVLLVLLIGILAATPIRKHLEARLKRTTSVWQPTLRLRAIGWVESAGLLVLLIASMVYLATDTYNPFIYFRF